MSLVKYNRNYRLIQPGKIGGVIAGVNPTDAVNKSQLDALQAEVDAIEAGSQTIANLSLTDTTQSTTTATGTLIVAGGAGIAKNLFVGGVFGARNNVLASSGNLTLTTAMSGATMLFDGVALAYTLPAIDTTNIGMYFDFFTTVASTSAQSVTAGTGDLMTGGINLIDDTAAYTAPQNVIKKPATTFLICSMNGTTTGGKIGTKIRFTAISATAWFVEGVAFGSGVLSTPFS